MLSFSCSVLCGRKAQRRDEDAEKKAHEQKSPETEWGGFSEGPASRRLPDRAAVSPAPMLHEAFLSVVESNKPKAGVSRVGNAASKTWKSPPDLSGSARTPVSRQVVAVFLTWRVGGLCAPG